jgi:hypothetical protein
VDKSIHYTNSQGWEQEKKRKMTPLVVMTQPAGLLLFREQAAVAK